MNTSRLRRGGFTFWQVVIVLLTVALLSVIFFPMFGRGRGNSRSSCHSNLKQISLGIRQYVQDYDERFPSVASGAKANSGKARDFSAFGWADALQPYTKWPEIFQCSSENTARQSLKPDPKKTHYTDYWFNARLSRVRERQILEPAQTVMLGDGNDGTDATDARYHLMSIPDKWRGDENSPLHRHLGGAYFAFADGHVKWLDAGGWKNGISNGDFTFRLGSAK